MEGVQFFATLVYFFATIFSARSTEEYLARSSGESPVMYSASSTFFFCYARIIFFCYEVSCEVSCKLNRFLLFYGRTIFYYTKAKAGYLFCTTPKQKFPFFCETHAHIYAHTFTHMNVRTDYQYVRWVLRLTKSPQAPSYRRKRRLPLNNISPLIRHQNVKSRV
jgi:hypothetical protein